MIDIATEQLLSLRAASKLLPDNPNLSTLYRWFMRGCHGVKLETVLIGSRRYTSRESLQRFAERTTAAATGEPIPTRTAKQREREIAAAEAELDGAGI